MILYFSGLLSESVVKTCDFSKLYVLQAFPYINDRKAECIPKLRGFLLDSGAFTMLNSKKKQNFDILEYAKKYALFIKKHNIKDFIELDIDEVFGIEKYLDCLHIVQDITGRDPLRVFHVHRGKEYYEELVKQKNRVCIGGVAIKTIKPSEYDILLDWLVQTAHKNNCKVHVLGLTKTSAIRKYDVDSTDSTRWLMPQKKGLYHRFNGHDIAQIETHALPIFYDTWQLRDYAFEQWNKYAEYMQSYADPIILKEI